MKKRAGSGSGSAIRLVRVEVWIRIGIKVKGSIRIWIRINVMWIRNTASKCLIRIREAQKLTDPEH
jgi:hypothetical protein